MSNSELLKEKTIERLMSEGIGGLDNQAAIQHIGLLIDAGTDLSRKDAFERGLVFCEQLEPRLTESDRLLLDYFRANAWEGIRKAKFASVGENTFAWEQPEMARMLFYLRRVVKNPSFSKLDEFRQCQIQTNLGNALSDTGRFIEAIEHWTAALKIDKRFAMALGRRGINFRIYAMALYNQTHVCLFAKAAHDDLTSALSRGTVWEGGTHAAAKVHFDAYRAQIEKEIPDIKTIVRDVDLNDYRLGRSLAEQKYRRWCLRNRLFLNPLNDLGEHLVAAHDPLTLPDFVTGKDKFEHTPTPMILSLFNQMKQEYVSSRYLCYEGIVAKFPHFADRDVRLTDTLDYPAHSLAIEKLRFAFRSAYSIFDKIAFFLNVYLELNLKPSDVDFRHIWYEKKKLRHSFAATANLPLRGLFWLTKDLAKHDSAINDPTFVTAPDAEELKTIRNYLEHRCLKIHNERMGLSSKNEEFIHSLTRHDFQLKTVQILKLARVALIYLSLGMHWAERKKRKESKGGIVAPMPPLSTIPDKWKR